MQHWAADYAEGKRRKKCWGQAKDETTERREKNVEGKNVKSLKQVAGFPLVYILGSNSRFTAGLL